MRKFILYFTFKNIYIYIYKSEQPFPLWYLCTYRGGFLCNYINYLPTHLDMLVGTWQALGSCKARVELRLMPRLGSLRSLRRTQRHFLLFSTTCFSPLQQSNVGVLACPPTYGRHVASPTSLSAHSALSWSIFELTNPIFNTTTSTVTKPHMYGAPTLANFEPIFALCVCLREREREREVKEIGWSTL